uniref:Uncharacterized protein n=1 Tax=viral metagenome TaxID=1070528 RepID=A0A6C0I5F4_9ZZZZ
MEPVGKDHFREAFSSWITRAVAGERSVLFALESHLTNDPSVIERQMTIGRHHDFLESILSQVDKSLLSVLSECDETLDRYTDIFLSQPLNSRPHYMYNRFLMREHEVTPIFSSQTTDLRQSTDSDDVEDARRYLTEIDEALIHKPVVVFYVGIAHYKSLLNLFLKNESNLGVNLFVYNLTSLSKVMQTFREKDQLYLKRFAPVVEEESFIQVGKQIEDRYPQVEPDQSLNNEYRRAVFYQHGHPNGTRVVLSGLSTVSMNGKKGTITSRAITKNGATRQGVVIDGSREPIAVKLENLKSAQFGGKYKNKTNKTLTSKKYKRRRLTRQKCKLWKQTT